jgi:hypothetical protein
MTILLGVGMATSLGSMAVLTSKVGTVGVLGVSSLNTGTVRVGNSGTLDIKSGLSASGSGVALQYQWALAPTSEGHSV